MNATLPHTPSVRSFQPGEGYLYFVGQLQIVAGVLTVLFSLLTMIQAWTVNATAIMSPAEIYSAFGSPHGGWFNKLLAAYMSFQVMFGWIIGLLMISAGICCLKNRGRTWVALTACLSLVNFPHGTTVALMVLHGLTRPRISGALRG